MEESKCTCSLSRGRCDEASCVQYVQISHLSEILITVNIRTVRSYVDSIVNADVVKRNVYSVSSVPSSSPSSPSSFSSICSSFTFCLSPKSANTSSENYRFASHFIIKSITLYYRNSLNDSNIKAINLV
ncbi:hypothetical protein BBBOND_0304090 [Babesia bigemina]|uniref:Uncharacterized protein n=1 Tax=Babesia bigemina TaxID=5866 RepID=A0A061DDR7_BABBI|nr:hypothetical protein BBBOND_0304090 [Babesia bigemina]CDR96505.1 hypothetical protein BBBOND_0304090 [Babesia bigemina]|eukprot:XP_012768691.1 hypothetical protein BBBOND_0304090 [Babesia bigemina]